MNSIKNSMPARPLFRGKWSKKLNEIILGKIVQVGYVDSKVVDYLLVTKVDTNWSPEGFDIHRKVMRNVDSPEQIIGVADVSYSYIIDTQRDSFRK